MKKPASKAQLRAIIAAQVDDYLELGGAITRCQQGETGVEPGSGPPRPNTLFDDRPKEARTFVPEIVAALEARKQALRGPQRSAPRKPRSVARKQLVYDDFGEPLRWRWHQD
ncbi:MAG TPA: hypothetical protein VL027_10470 [Spongiibacteraceae bacterium]|nr:hypothetical protein [Spongiibacteraceae bacterium]HUH38356.1 hypothetical protein [Spongiibacteraceae bacterium]